MKKSVRNLLILGGIFGTTLAIGGSVALASCATSGSTTTQQANMGSINNGDLNGLKPGAPNKDNVEQNKNPSASENKQETAKNDNKEDAPSTPSSQPTQTPSTNKPVQKPTTSGSSGSTTTGNNTANKQEVTTQTGSKKATLLSRALAKAEVSNDTTSGSTEHTPANRITKTFESG